MTSKTFAACGLTCLALFSNAEPLALPNPGFEEGEAHWRLDDKGMSRVAPEAAHAGKSGLRVVDTSETAGSSCRSASVHVVPGKDYALRFWARPVEDIGNVGVYLQFADAQSRCLNTEALNNELCLTTPAEPAEWSPLVLYGKAPKDAAAVAVWIHSFDASTGKADLDDFSLTEASAQEVSVARREALLSSSHGFPSPDPKRIAEIAAWLPGTSRGLGRPGSDREAWNRLAALPEAAKLIERAAALIDKPVPEVPDELYLEFTKTGNRNHYEKPYRQRVTQLNTLLLAECLEYKGRFLPALERTVLAICDERSWTMPAHDSSLSNFKGTQLTIDLGSSARGWLLSTVDYWLGDKLTPAAHERLRKEVHRRVLDVYLAAVRDNDVHGNWWMKGENNWNAVCTAGVVCSALALFEKPEERAEVLAAMEISNPRFISGFTRDGYCSEGMGYWNYGFGHFVALGLAVRDATGDRLDIFKGKKLPRIADYARGFQIQTGCSPFFADGGGSPSPEVWALLRQVYPEAVPADAPPYPLLSGGSDTVALCAFGQEPPPPSRKDAGLPLHTWFANAQVLLTRSAPGSQPPFGAAIKGGHNAELHNHNDVGSYTVVLDGLEMMGDPGGEVYTRRTFSSHRYDSKMLNSYGHPVPVVAGLLQPTGRAAAAKVLGSSFEDARDRLELDLTKAYGVPELKTLHRTLVHDRASRAIEIVDAVHFASPQTFSSPLITYRDVDRRDNSTLYLHDKTRCVEVRITAEGGAWHLDEESIENPEKASPRRLAVTFDQPVEKARVKFHIAPCALPADLAPKSQATKPTP